MTEQSELFWHIESVALLREPGRLRALGAALDSEPDFRVTHVGRSFPPGRAINGTFTDYLAGFHDRLKPAEQEMWFFERRDAPHGAGDIYLLDNGRLRHNRAHELNGSFKDARWFSSHERLERLSRYLTRIADAAGAFYGYCSAGEMLDQRLHLLQRSSGPIFGWIFHAGRAAHDRDRELPDVHWWNYFGPAFVERWDGRMDGLGARQATTPAGARVIWSTASPFVYDPSASWLGAYAWKRPFYMALGDDTFMREGQKRGAVGELVPTWADHYRAAGVDVSTLEGPEPPVIKGGLFPKVVRLRERPADTVDSDEPDGGGDGD